MLKWAADVGKSNDAGSHAAISGPRFASLLWLGGLWLFARWFDVAACQG
jgi:hypothetical protein